MLIRVIIRILNYTAYMHTSIYPLKIHKLKNIYNLTIQLI